jgi:hypothetical protein
MSKLTISENQQERAEDLISKLEDGKIQSPKAILPDWRAEMSWKQFDERTEYDVYKKREEDKTRKWIPTSDIVGPLGDSGDSVIELPTRADDLKLERLKKILRWMVEGEFKTDYDDYDLPHFVEFDGKFHVTKDGRHRSIACKAVGVGDIFGEVSVIR